jgi:hypothetical protein
MQINPIGLTHLPFLFSERMRSISMEQTNNNPPAPQSPASETPPVQTPAPAATQETQEDQPKYVTKEELAAAIELGFRRAQKSAKSRTLAVETQVTELKTRLEKAGIAVTPEITQNLRQQAADELEDQDVDQPQTAAAQTPASVPGQAGNPVFDWTMEAYKAEGIDIKPTDPEFAEIKKVLDDPAGNMYVYQKTVLKAIETKRERTTSQRETADARVLGGGTQPSGQVAPRTAHEAWEQAYKPK